MSESIPHCAEYGKSWQDEISCQDYFYQMLYWEAENPALWEVHHLMCATLFSLHAR